MGAGVRMSRSRGSLSGLMLVLLGAWGGLGPLIGPYFRFGFQPTQPWHYSMGRLFLSLIPGGVVLLAGLVVLITKSRWAGGLSALLAALGGAWFIGGQTTLLIVTGTTYTDGAPVATAQKLILLTNLACFTGTGVLIIFFAALALGRQSIAAHKDHLKFGESTAATAASGGLASVGLGMTVPGYDQDQATVYQPAEYQPAEYQPAEYQPAGYQPAEYQADGLQTADQAGGYQASDYQTAGQSWPATGTTAKFGPSGSMAADGPAEPVTGSQPVVGGQSQFPSQYPDSFAPYDPATSGHPADEDQPGPITYSAGQTKYPGAGPRNSA
jgi:hypothetical protein